MGGDRRRHQLVKQQFSLQLFLSKFVDGLKSQVYGCAPFEPSLRKGLDFYKDKGFVPMDVGISEACSRTLDFGFADAACASVAGKLGKKEMQELKQRSRKAGALKWIGSCKVILALKKPAILKCAVVVFVALFGQEATILIPHNCFFWIGQSVEIPETTENVGWKETEQLLKGWKSWNRTKVWEFWDVWQGNSMTQPGLFFAALGFRQIFTGPQLGFVHRPCSPCTTWRRDWWVTERKAWSSSRSRQKPGAIATLKGRPGTIPFHPLTWKPWQQLGGRAARVYMYT